MTRDDVVWQVNHDGGWVGARQDPVNTEGGNTPGRMAVHSLFKLLSHLAMATDERKTAIEWSDKTSSTKRLTTRLITISVCGCWCLLCGFGGCNQWIGSEVKKKRKKRKPQTRRGGGESKKKKKMKNGEKQNSSLNPFVGSSFLCVFLSVFLSLSFCLSLSLSRNRNVAKIRGSCGRIPILGIPRCGVDDRVLRQRLHCAGIRLHCGPSVQSCDYHQNVSNMWTVKSASCIRQREQILFLYCDQLLRFGFITGAQSQTS